MTLKKIANVLCNARTAGTIFPHPLPEGEQKVCRILVLKQQVNLIDVDPGALAQRAVADDPVEDAVQHHQHADGQKLLAQITDVVAENSRIGIHVGGLGEGIETAVCEQLHGQSHVPCFRLRLFQQLCVEVPSGR